jgi:glycosyltransferase involved in cell wall biosynthesis
MNISIVVPTVDSEKKITKSISSLVGFIESKKNIDNYEIIIAAQTSKDKTFEIIQKMKFKKVRPVFVKKRGKGIGLTEGIKRAKYDLIMMIDDDLPYLFSYFDNMIDEIKKKDIVIASRYCKKRHHDTRLIRKIASVSYITLVKLFLGIPQKDIQAGMKIFRRKVFEKTGFPKEIGYVWDTEMLYYANKKKFKIKEVPVTYFHEENKLKVRRVAFKMLKGVIRIWTRQKMRSIFY